LRKGYASRRKLDTIEENHANSIVAFASLFAWYRKNRGDKIATIGSRRAEKLPAAGLSGGATGILARVGKRASNQPASRQGTSKRGEDYFMGNRDARGREKKKPKKVVPKTSGQPPRATYKPVTPSVVTPTPTPSIPEKS
jgi:hypothetical protein